MEAKLGRKKGSAAYMAVYIYISLSLPQQLPFRHGRREGWDFLRKGMAITTNCLNIERTIGALVCRVLVKGILRLENSYF